MRFFIDTANLDEIREAASWGIIEGCTTNPSLVARAGGDFVENVRAICELVQGPVSAEVVATDTEGMLREARWLARIHEHVVVKIPMTAQGLAAVKRLSAEGIRTNVTLVFQPAQALLAARAGATYVSPFVGRLDDVGEDGMELVRQVVEIFEDDPEIRTEVIVASVRHPRHVVEAALAGAQIATVPFAVLKKLLHHPLTERGIERFLADWEPLQVDIERDVRRFLEARGEL